MQHVSVNIEGMKTAFTTARSVAIAAAETVEKRPVVIAWHDKTKAQIAPAIEGADLETRWRDYGQSYGGNLEVVVNDEMEFIFGDSEKFESSDPAEDPYINVRDPMGREFLCMKQAVHGDDEPCTPLQSQAS